MSRRRPPSRSTASAKPYTGRRLSTRRSAEDSAREAAAWVVERTLSTLSPSATFLENALARCDRRDHRLLRELSLGTLRWLRRLDDVISRASDRPFDSIEPALQAPLRIATYQLLFLDRLPAYAIVDEGVEQARRLTHRGGASFANAVLRRIARQRRLAAWPVEEGDRLRRLAIEKSHPDFLVERWVERFGWATTKRLLDINNQPKALPLLAFRDRGGRELLAEQLIDEGFTVEPSRLSPVALVVTEGNPLFSEAFARGDFYIQDEASQAAALIPPPRPGERILDAAAAPGGKSFALLAFEPTARLVLSDVSLPRMGRLRRNLHRLGRPLPVVISDAGQPTFAGADSAALFDRVIVDLPCCGTGTLRKNPELKWRISEDEIGRLSRQSLRLLRASLPLVAEGGLLIAMTCSLEPEENESVIATLLAETPELRLLELAGKLAYPLDDSIIGPGAWRLLPADHHDGFTVHVMTRR